MNTPELRRVMEHFDRFGVGYAQTFIAAVPEPGICAMLGLLSCFGMRRAETSGKLTSGAMHCGCL
jgi:hypothetical protein